MERKLNDDEIGNIRRALTDARKGRATLKQLAHAHDLAQDHHPPQLSATIGELREHIRSMTPAPPEKGIKNIIKSLVLGTISGIITWSLLGRREDSK